jgi:5-methyltetrahydropteroyltriglutamate--homocysteine methyltransferase
MNAPEDERGTKVTNTAAGAFDLARTDQVGSLLRPPALKAAWAAHGRGELDEGGLLAAQRAAVAVVVAEQERRGILPVCDGEFWRRGFQETFANSVSGYRPAPAPAADGPRPDGQIPESVYVRRQGADARLALAHNELLEEYLADRELGAGPFKVTITGPERLTQRFDLEHSLDVYDSFETFMGDVVRIEREIIGEVIAAGCSYMHIDEPAYTAYVDPTSLEWMRERGWDPAAGLARGIAADNALIAGFPNTTFGLHICRGNDAGSWHREGAYDDIAEQLFTNLEYDRLLLEYDTERAGSFAPLRFVPKGKVAVLGLISTKTGVLEDIETVLRRIDEAATYLPLDQLAISPQCGFASGLGGNPLTEDEQWSKLGLVQEVAARVWG